MRAFYSELGRSGLSESKEEVREYTAAEALLDVLTEASVDRVFGYPGGAILPLYDALYGSPIEHVLVRHEQAAVMAADGYARSSGRVGVCIATSGPGATNLVTGIAGAFADSIPLLAITGQVPSETLGTDAFQEVDVLGVTMPIVKHSYLVRDPNELADVVREALQLACSGRPGPVVIDVPKDVLAAKVDPLVAPLDRPTLTSVLPSEQDLDRAIALLRAAQRPVAYIGGGVVLGNATDSCRTLLRRLNIPTVCTLKAIGVMPSGETLGMLGMHGTQAANYAVQSCDLLVCLGARFDDRVTGKLAGFAPGARVIHFDIDPAEIGKRRHANVQLVGNLRSTVPMLDEHIPDGMLDIESWRAQCKAFVEREQMAAQAEAVTEHIEGPNLVRQLSNVLPPRSVVSCDVGQHQMWVAQHARFSHPRDHLSHGGLGAMGYGLPAAIGAQFARPDACVVNVSGDGSFMMNVQELATIKRYELPVKLVLLDNSCLGMVRQWQHLFLQQRYSEVDLSDNPDFVAVSEAFGIPAERITRADQIVEGLERLVDTPGPRLLHVVLEEDTFVWPFVPPGASNGTMLNGRRGHHV